jgi:hypothetical protein
MTVHRCVGIMKQDFQHQMFVRVVIGVAVSVTRLLEKTQGPRKNNFYNIVYAVHPVCLESLPGERLYVQPDPF